MEILDIEEMPTPLCARCGKSVQSMQVTRAENGQGIIIRVECHGRTEEHPVYYGDDLPTIVTDHIAFAIPRVRGVA